MIVNISSNDYSNFGHENANALRSIGLTCADYTLNRHKFGYRTQSVKISRTQISDLCSGKIVQIMHGCPYLFEIVKRSNPKKIIIYQTGTRYRNEPDKFNRLFKGHKSITDQTEFMSLGDFEYLVSPVQLPLEQLYSGNKDLILAHYPSNAEIKGTADIKLMLRPFKSKFNVIVDTRRTTHLKQLERMANCDVYVELFKPDLDGNPYGCFGVTALEAASMGKLVVTNNLNEHVYDSVYSLNPFFIANTKDEFHEVLTYLSKKTPEEIRQMQIFTKEIMLINHSYKATGERIAKLIGL